METNSHDQIQSAKNSNQVILPETNVEIAKRNVSQEFQNILVDIENLIKSLTALTGSELEASKTQLKQRIATAKTAIADLRNNLNTQASNTFLAADTYVHEQPWRAVGTSAAIGLLLGLILARRN